ncbi:MAG: baseplate J/gp47 family protein [Fibrobacter sp.]|nr:baseplate J/gp47 family protein [Fibrobacter sp.]
MGIYDNLNAYTAQAILQSALNQVTANVDKREGAVIYDTIAPLAVIAAQIIGIMKTALENTDIQTARGGWLDQIASQPPVGIYRSEGQKAQKTAQATPITAEIPIGARFSTQNEMGNMWRVTQKLTDGRYVLECETVGAEQSNDYGELTPEAQDLDIVALVFEDEPAVVEGRDKEDDEAFRMRIWQGLKRERYGGSFSDYLKWCFDDFANDGNGATLDGIMFFPATRYIGGGNIMIRPTTKGQDGKKYMPATAETCSRLKEFLDPETNTGQGAGKVPVGHKVAVVQPSADEWVLDIQVVLKTGHSEITDEDVRQAAENIEAYFEEKRGEIVSEMGEPFPNEDGTEGGYKTTVYIDQIRAAATGSGAIFQSAQTVKRGSENAVDTTYKPKWDQALLPVITSVSIHT